MNSSSSTSGPTSPQGFTSFATKCEKRFRFNYLIIGLAALIAMAVVTAIVMTNTKHSNSSNESSSAAVRNPTDPSSPSDALNYVLNEIASNMNPSVDPCDDFYEYACGSFPKRYPIPSGKTQVNYHTIYTDRVYRTIVDRLRGDELLSSETSEHLKYLKRIWDSCVEKNLDTSGQVEKLKKYLEELEQLDSWQEKFVKLTKDGYNLLFTIKISGILLSNTQVVIGPPKLNWEKVYAKNSHLLLEYYTQMARTIIDDSIYNLAHSSVIWTGFEHGLAKETTSESEKGRSPLVSSMSVKELSNWTGINWNKLLNQMFATIKFTESTRIYVDDVNYIKQFDFSKSYLKDAFLNEYFKVAVLDQSCFFISQECRNLQYNLLEQTESILLPKYQNESQFVESHCFDFLVDNFEDLMYNVWNSLTHDEALNVYREFDEMINTLSAAFDEMITNQITWMDEETKSQARDFFRGEQFSTSVQAPSYVHENFNIRRAYQKAPYLDSTDTVKLYDYFRGVIKWTKDELFSIKDFKDTLSWPIPLFSTLPFLEQDSSSFFVPDFFVQGPFSASDLPDSIKFGFYVSMLAHEITHSFDSVADYYRGVHGKEPFWSKRTRSNFNDKIKCLVDAYEEEIEVCMYGDETVQKINGTSSLSENLADLIGLNVALDTFEKKKNANTLHPDHLPNSLKGLTDEQLFFLSYANVHCSNRMKLNIKSNSIIEPPPKFMVNLPLAHTDKFAQHFSCKLGTKMNPNEKCSFK